MDFNEYLYVSTGCKFSSSIDYKDLKAASKKTIEDFNNMTNRQKFDFIYWLEFRLLYPDIFSKREFSIYKLIDEIITKNSIQEDLRFSIHLKHKWVIENIRLTDWYREVALTPEIMKIR